MSRKAQIWIETVIYTLIGLAIIGIVLGIIKPAIEERKDSISIAQSIDLLNVIDSKINEIKYVPGNAREMEIKISRGKLIVDSQGDKVQILIEDSKTPYSEEGIEVSVGSIGALTEKKGSKYSVSLTLDYKQKLNITYMGGELNHTFQAAASPYNVAIKNKGAIGEGQNPLTNIDFF